MNTRKRELAIIGRHSVDCIPVDAISVEPLDSAERLEQFTWPDYRKYNFWATKDRAAAHVAKRLHLSIGFVEEGRQRESKFTNGRYYDILLYGITAEEYNHCEVLSE